jgi:hypothetical protein
LHTPPTVWDFHLMDRVLDCNQFNPRQIRLINYCRFFLQVHAVADLAAVEGTHIDLCFIHGNPSLLSSRSLDLEIYQERPYTLDAWNACRKECAVWCNVKTGALHESLGPWKVPSVSLRRSWPFHWDPPTGRLLVRTADGYNVTSPGVRTF